jgi:predicted dehydrogenase
MPSRSCSPIPARNSDSKRLKVAVAGLGSFGSLHAKAYSQNPGALLSAVCDADPKRLKSVAKSLGVRKRYTDFAKMLDENDDIGLVSIATPDDQHFPMAVMAARAGKSILLEKPMCSTIADADRLIELARASKIKLMVDFILRFDPRYLKARELIRSGEVGRIATINARRHVKALFGMRHASFSNLYVDVAIHDIDVSMWLTSERPVEVYSVATGQHPGHGEDAIFGILRFKSGTVALIDANWLAPDKNMSVVEGELRVVGSKGTVEVRSDQQGIEYATNQEGPVSPDISLWSVIDGRVFGDLRESIDHMVSCVRFDRKPAVGPEEGRNALLVALTLRESMRRAKPLRIRW